jgi:hypothetical protein
MYHYQLLYQSSNLPLQAAYLQGFCIKKKPGMFPICGNVPKSHFPLLAYHIGTIGNLNKGSQCSYFT